MKIKNLLLAALLPFLFVACSDDDDTNNPVDNTKIYMPLKVGNYWVYDTYDLDMQNNTVASTFALDSVVATGTESYLSKNSYHLKRYVDNEFKNDMYFVWETNKVMAESNYILPLSSSGFNLPLNKITNQWITIADFSATGEWDVLTHKFTQEAITLPGLPSGVTFTADYKVKGKKGTTQAMTVGGQSVQATEMILTHTVTGTLNYLVISAPITFSIVQKFYYAENIGLVKSVTESQTVNISIVNQKPQSYDINGHSKVLTRYIANK